MFLCVCVCSVFGVSKVEKNESLVIRRTVAAIGLEFRALEEFLLLFQFTLVPSLTCYDFFFRKMRIDVKTIACANFKFSNSSFY